jgi:hypothetical protein
MPRVFPLALAAVLLVACDRPGDPEKVRDVARRALRGSITYPNSGIVSVSAGEDAAELVMSSPDSMELVVAWFRRALPLGGWTIKRDGRDQRGAVTLYAEQGPRPLWITLRPNTGGQGTTYTLIGAVLQDDTTTAITP